MDFDEGSVVTARITCRVRRAQGTCLLRLANDVNSACATRANRLKRVHKIIS